MKQIISFLLAAVLLVMPCQQTAAVFAQSTSAKMETSRMAATGQVDVSIIPALKFDNPTEFYVKLSGAEMQLKQIGLSKDQGGQYPDKAETSFTGIEPGTYTLEVTAPGFATYSQEIQVAGNQAYGIKLMTGFVSGYPYEGKAHPGVLLIGDVNGDGKIDDTDKKILTDAVHSAGQEAGADSESADTQGTGSEQEGISESKIAPTDLNRDGRTNLVDLEYFSKGYQETKRINSTLETSIPASMIRAEEGDDTVVKGSLDDLLKCGSIVSLSRDDKKPISKDAPVAIDFVLENNDTGSKIGGIVLETGFENPISTAELVVTEESGETVTIQVPKNGLGIRSVRQLQAADAKVEKSGSGTICVDFGKQVAVKRITLRITGMENPSSLLAEISRVTFIDDMASRIPEPETDIPKNLKAVAGSASFTLDWSECENITGYEVCIKELDAKDSGEEIIQVAGNTLSVSSLSNNKKVENYKKYEAKVRSANGLWRSGYSESVTVEPKPEKLPDAPDYVNAAGKYKSVQVSWKKVKDSVSYNLYYKRADVAQYIKIEGIKENTYTVTGLAERVKYEFYVTGVNQLGEGKPSLTASAVTKSMELAGVPKYKMINQAAYDEVSPYITHASTGSGSMQDSAKDTGNGTAWGSVDNNVASYYLLNSWDSGGYNTLGKNGLFFEFDQAYKMQMITLQEPVSQDVNYAYAQIRYWDADGKDTLLGRNNVSVQKKTDAEGRIYYMLRLPAAITAKKIQIGLARSVASSTIAVSEVYFYHYDPLEDEIMGLYTDDLHTVLRSDVTQETISALRTRVNTKEAESGEYHPDKEMLIRELQTAEDILNSSPHEPVRIHSTITTKDVNRGFGGLNAWQPLGVTAAAGDEITVYVGHSRKRTGDTAALQLVATQYHSEASAMFKAIATLKIGRNDITIPQIGSIDKERGGALYVQYTGNSADDDYAVRVNGGVQTPVLDLYQVTDKSVRMQRITDYISKLETYVEKMPEKHEQLHQGSTNQNVKYTYEEQNCILGATDILLDTMMLSLPATQVLSGTGTGDKAGALSQSMQAMEDMMHLFYQHKGLNQNAEKAIDKIPSCHQNIRYQRMFAGAFMYASGNHVGIEYNEAKGMVSSKPVVADAQGRYKSGRYFGWGIAHEIGHCINQGAYAIAEVTNNYFSVLAQAKDRNDSVRFSYDDVYKKVTSNETGRASNVFTQLGMYWQLHLAYDKGYNYKTYDGYKDQLENLFFARVDSYARTPANAPAPKKIKLSLSGDKDQNLMRLSCAAAEKDILEFFRRWGMEPDAETEKYAGQFVKKEKRAIYYANDDARVYQLTGGKPLPASQAGLDSAKCVVRENDGVVSITADLPVGSEDKVLGYEVVRTVRKAGGIEIERQLAGFAVADKTSGKIEFQDKVTTMNNRVIRYEIALIDKFLNRVATKVLEPVKVSMESYMDKSDWKLKVDHITVDTDISDGSTECEQEQKALIQGVLQKAIDGDDKTFFTGTASENAEVILEFGKSYAVTALRYCGSAASCQIYVRDMDGSWIETVKKQFAGTGAETVSLAKNGKFHKNEMAYQTDAVKLVFSGKNKLTVNELDVLKVAGDNIEFGIQAGSSMVSVGILKEAFRYGKEEADVITKGALVFIGSYRGNPAYNAVLLYDENGNPVGGKDSQGTVNAETIFMAEVPKDGPIQNVADGKWIYYINPEYVDAVKKELAGKKIRAELYRVDHAQTMEGQRLVSDTAYITIQNLPEIQLKSIIDTASAQLPAEHNGTGGSGT